MAIEVRLLARGDQRRAFDCGHDELNVFFWRYSGQNQFRHHIGVTYIAVEEDAILGFVTISVATIEREQLDASLVRRLPTYPLPALRLSRLATSVDARGKGVGGRLLRHVFEMALLLRDQAGCIAVVVDAKPDAVAFYERYGFQAFRRVVEGTLLDPENPQPMYLHIRDIAHNLS